MVTTVIAAELWALRDSLQLAISKGIQQLEVKLSAQVVIKCISDKL